MSTPSYTLFKLSWLLNSLLAKYWDETRRCRDASDELQGSTLTPNYPASSYLFLCSAIDPGQPFPHSQYYQNSVTLWYLHLSTPIFTTKSYLFSDQVRLFVESSLREDDSEDGVRPTARLIHIRRGNGPVVGIVFIYLFIYYFAEEHSIYYYNNSDSWLIMFMQQELEVHDKLLH